MNITIDGKMANMRESSRYRGLGMVSANNSSRLLLDYKAVHPEQYWELLRYLFGPEGLALTHLKLEMGADVNSSSGTEPAIKRRPDEPADVTRGAGFQLAADAKSVNPELTLDMLWWSEPRWVTDAADVYAARYRWYTETLGAAYERYGLCFDYVSANQNERAIDTEWIKYLSAHLAAERNAPYDYAAIRIVAADEEGSFEIAELMRQDAELREAVDVIAAHYTDWATEAVRELARAGKEIWFSEGCAPMSYARGTHRFDAGGTGLSDTNGMLDIANRIIAMYPCGEMTLYEFQPAVAAYYDGATFCQKQLVRADTPWNGCYSLDTGFYMALHFSQFIKRGWRFLEGACRCDGSPGADGHTLVGAVESCMAACDIQTGDYSCVMTNSTDREIRCRLTVRNLCGAEGEQKLPLHIWETRGPDSRSGEPYDAHYLEWAGRIMPQNGQPETVYSFALKPYSLVTVSTLSYARPDFASLTARKNTCMKLPYRDDFSYKRYGTAFLEKRGYAPLYMTDIGGAFEVVRRENRYVLQQRITEPLRAAEWGYTPEPVTCFGDDRWFHYALSAQICLAEGTPAQPSYAGIGIRYALADCGQSGYWLRYDEGGGWRLMRGRSCLAAGRLPAAAAAGSWVTLRLQAEGERISALIDGVCVCRYRETLGGALPAERSGAEGLETAGCGAGRAALYSSYHENCFAQLEIEPAGTMPPDIVRIDDTDMEIDYCGGWEHLTMSSFQNYRRTVSAGKRGAEFAFSFQGNMFALLGGQEGASVLRVEIDGQPSETRYSVPPAEARSCVYRKYVPDGLHHVRIAVLEGRFCLDALEASGRFCRGLRA